MFSSINNLSAVEREEFEKLVIEIKQNNFKSASQVSNYIMKNKLGTKYPNISGILEMEQDGRYWQFKGGFPPKIYAMLCTEIGLENEGSDAKPGLFTPFKYLND